MLRSAEDVLTFWFGSKSDRQDERASTTYVQGRMGMWFAGQSPSFDEVQRLNTELLATLGSESVTLQADWSSPQGILARVIVLDQFPRCIFRGTAKAFQFDHIVASLVQEVVAAGWMGSFSPVERFFLGVAAQHSEDLVMQEIGVSIARSVADGASEEVQAYFRNLKGYPMEHYEVIKLFGRFPSRNAALGREGTAEELAWMASPDCPAWAKSQVVVVAVTGTQGQVGADSVV